MNTGLKGLALPRKCFQRLHPNVKVLSQYCYGHFLKASSSASSSAVAVVVVVAEALIALLKKIGYLHGQETTTLLAGAKLFAISVVTTEQELKQEQEQEEEEQEQLNRIISDPFRSIWLLLTAAHTLSIKIHSSIWMLVLSWKTIHYRKTVPLLPISHQASPESI